MRLHLCVAPMKGATGGHRMCSFVSRAISLVSRGLPLGGRMTGAVLELRPPGAQALDIMAVQVKLGQLLSECDGDWN